jgi:hypothetical protein
MKRFVLVQIGFDQPTPEMMAAWDAWFQSIADITIENVGLGPAIEVSQEGTRELPFDHSAVTGYTVIKVESREKALEIAQACPFISGVCVYEVRGYQTNGTGTRD